MEPELIEIHVPCEPCKGTGEVTGLVLTGRHFFDPYEEVTGTCRECFGRGFTRKEVCSNCGLEICPCFEIEKREDAKTMTYFENLKGLLSDAEALRETALAAGNADKVRFYEERIKEHKAELARYEEAA